MQRATLYVLLLLVAARVCGEDSEFVPFDVAPWPIDSLCVAPEYPEMIARAGVPGTVDLNLRIDSTGRVVDTKIAYCKPQRLGFEEATLAACTTWVFTPAQAREKAVSVWIDMRFSFVVLPCGGLPRDSLQAEFAEQEKVFADSMLQLRATDPSTSFVPPPVVYISLPTKVVRYR